MNIVLASDDNFVQHCAVTITSILCNNSGVRLYLLTEGLSKYNEGQLQMLVSKLGGELKIVNIPKDFVNKLPMPKDINLSHISVATYYRLFIPELLPASVDKCIYMDCDIVVRKSLSSLYEVDLSNYAIGAVYQNDSWALYSDVFGRLDIPQKYGYFNAGVLLINIDYWRKHDILSLMRNYLKNNFHLIVCHDQDVLNAVLYRETKILDCTWNMLSSYFTKSIFKHKEERFVEYRRQILSGVKDDPAIVHFVSRPKPWEPLCYNPYTDDYYKYLELTPWKDFKRPIKKMGLIQRVLYFVKGPQLLKINRTV